MHIEPPIRAGTARGNTVQFLSRASAGQKEDPVAHAWNNVSPPNKDSARASDGHGTDREERLLRMADILRTEQVSASTVAEKEIAMTGFHRRSGLGAWVIVFILMGVAALLLIFRPTHPILSERIGKVKQPQPSDGAGDADVATERPIRLSLSPLPEDHAQSLPITEHQETRRSDIAEAATSLAGSIAETDSVDLSTPRPEANLPANPPLAAITGGVSHSNPNKALLVYVPHSSLRAETNARSLLARINVDLTVFASESKSALPDDAVIKFSAESNHALARTVGKSLGDLGYRWRIENSSDLVAARRNFVEVWLPR